MGNGEWRMAIPPIVKTMGILAKNFMKPNPRLCGFCRHYNDIRGCPFNIQDVFDCELLIEYYEDRIGDYI